VGVGVDEARDYRLTGSVDRLVSILCRMLAPNFVGRPNSEDGAVFDDDTGVRDGVNATVVRVCDDFSRVVNDCLHSAV
jgi:hypothetical protein